MDKIAKLEGKRKLYESLFDNELHTAFVKQKLRRFSQKALLGAICVCIYQDKDEFGLYFEILNLISEIDSYFMKWRRKYTTFSK